MQTKIEGSQHLCNDLTSKTNVQESTFTKEGGWWGVKGDVGAGNRLYYPESGATIGAQRAYFELGGLTAGDPVYGIRSFVLNLGDEDVTGITDRNYNNYNNFYPDDSWYSVDGRNIGTKPTAPGLYIYKGKATIIK